MHIAFEEQNSTEYIIFYKNMNKKHFKTNVHVHFCGYFCDLFMEY